MTDKNLFELIGTKKLANAPRAREVYAGLDEEEDEASPVAPRSGSAWAEADGRFWVAPKSHTRIPVGVFRMEINPQVGPVFVKQKNDTDEIVQLPDSESERIVEEIRQFKTLRAAFRDHGFLFKRGFLLWGPPGSGKTCTLQQIIQLMQEHDAVAVLVEHPSIATQALQALRRVEPERQIVAIFEDIDALCERFDESAYLSLLDGESQVDNIVYVATTNYPERLDRRFVDRPSRFDTVRHIGMPTATARAHYLHTKMPTLSDALIGEYVAASDGYSIAHLRELIILTRCFGMKLEQAVERLNFQRFSPPHSEQPPGKQPRMGSYINGAAPGDDFT